MGVQFLRALTGATIIAADTRQEALDLAIGCGAVSKALPSSITVAEPGALITGRLQRYEDGPDGWRRRWAWAFADDMLNPFDQPEGHIKRKGVNHAA